MSTTWTRETNLPARGRSFSNMDDAFEDQTYAFDDAWTPVETSWTEETYIA